MPDLRSFDLAQILWDYHRLGHPLRRADLILVLGSNDLRVADHAAALFHEAWAERLLFSGKVGALTEGLYPATEAETFAARAVELRVPPEAILIEPEATNTGENIAFSRRLLASRGLDPKVLIVVQKPYMERRAYATFRKVWPGREVVLSSPPIAWRDYPNEILPRDRVISIMVGDLQRIREYPRLGFQIEQEIPAAVWEAWEELVALGYSDHLLPHT